MNEGQFRGRIKLMYPGARFLQHAPVAAGQLDGEVAEQHFQYVSLYNHRIANSMKPVGGAMLVVSNGFLPSHAYNLALCWALLQGEPEKRASALAHNFKKFFAETALYDRNCMFGRAFLIETLCYEQDLMQPLFDRVRDEPETEKMAKAFGRLMGELVSHHELTHYFIERSRAGFEKEVATVFKGELSNLIARHGSLDSPFAEELACDAMALYMSLNAAELLFDRTTMFRLVVFAQAAFEILVSLEQSAHATASSGEGEDFDFGSELRPKSMPAFVLKPDDVMTRRVGEMIALLERQAMREGIDLYGVDGLFPLVGDPRPALRAVFHDCLDHRETPVSGLTGTDLHRRNMARLVAESLHGHDEGVEHLLWRSKTFSVGGNPVDP